MRVVFRWGINGDRPSCGIAQRIVCQRYAIEKIDVQIAVQR